MKQTLFGLVLFLATATVAEQGQLPPDGASSRHAAYVS